MEIKTLAQILAESTGDSASSVLPAEKPNSDESSVANIAEKTPRQTRRKKWQQQPSRKVTKALPLPQSDCNSDSHSDFDPSSLSMAIAKKKRRGKKRFHPASPYVPTDIAGHVIENKTRDHDDLERLSPSSNLPATTDSQSKPHASNSSFSSVSANEPSIQSILAEIRQRPAESRTNANTNLLARASDLLPNDAQLFSPVERTHQDDRLSDSDSTKGLPSALKAYLLTPEQRHAKKEAIKAESRLRWLAFYYLSRREHGRNELRQKLLDKDQHPDKVEALLEEFEEKGYQSDWRTSLMLIRESLRKGRGRQRIKQEFYRRKLDIPSNIDELIETAQRSSDEFADFIHSDNTDNGHSEREGVDWLELAVQARVKKYGNSLPTTPKDKAKQLRFLQYRGFKSDICFAALKYNLDNLDERY